MVLACNAALSKGVDETIYLFMKDEQQVAATFDGTNPLIITGLAMKATEKLYAYQGRNYSNAPKVTRNESDFDITFPHSITFLVFSNNAVVKRELTAMSTRKDLGVIYKRVGGDFEVMGYNTGMKMSSLEWDPNADNKGAWVITLTAENEVNLPHTLLHKTGGNDDTAAYLQTLVTP